jgi:hypothetical protein
MRRPDGSLFTAAFVALTLSDLAYFMGAGALIGVTPFFVTGPLGSGEAGVGVAWARLASRRCCCDRWPADGPTGTAAGHY